MNPEIYNSEEISAIESLFLRFRTVISDDESLYGFSLQEFDEVACEFPNVDLIDEGTNSIDHSIIVIHNKFAFVLDSNPTSILDAEEIPRIDLMWQKLRNV